MDILKLNIEQGEYSLGQIVVPQNFTKTAIKDGKMIAQEMSISGRKFRRYTKKSDHSSYEIYALNNS